MASRAVVLDTNFLLIPFQFKINIFAELEYLIEKNHHYVVSSRTISELKHLATKIGKDGMAARLALKLVESQKEKITIIENRMEVDDWIFKYSHENHAIACTNDAELRRRLRELKIKTISMKSKVKIGYI